MSLLSHYLSVRYDSYQYKDFSNKEKLYELILLMKKHINFANEDKKIFLTKKLFSKWVYIPIFSCFYLLFSNIRTIKKFKSQYSIFWFWRVWSGLVFINLLISIMITGIVILILMAIYNYDQKWEVWMMIAIVIFIFSSFFAFIFPHWLRLKYKDESDFSDFIYNFLYTPLIFSLTDSRNHFFKYYDEKKKTMTIEGKTYSDLVELVDWLICLPDEQILSLL